jgi:hypothetical protein
MQKILLIGLFILATQTTKAQTGVPDTLAYLQYIVANKSKFIGKPFSVLSDSLKIKIKFFFPFASIPHNKYKETSTSFAFYFPPTAEEIYLTYPHLDIIWRSPLNANQSRDLRSQFRAVGWNHQINSHYAANIIADIKVLE